MPCHHHIIILYDGSAKSLTHARGPRRAKPAPSPIARSRDPGWLGWSAARSGSYPPSAFFHIVRPDKFGL
jgi:hypothetical protein